MIGVYHSEVLLKLWFPEPTVVAIDELVDVFLQFGRGHSVIRTPQQVLKVCDGSYHLRPPFAHLLCGRGTRHPAT